MKKIAAFLCAVSSVSFASSVRLYNDSPYVLRAVVQGADGSKLGEVEVQQNQLMVWNDANGQMGYHEPTRSETPFTILWYCPEGLPYSVCSQVPNASMVTAQSCYGNRQCKTPPPPQLAPSSQQPELDFFAAPPVPGEAPEVQQPPPEPETPIELNPSPTPNPAPTPTPPTPGPNPPPSSGY